MELGGRRQHMYLKYHAQLRLMEPAYDDQVDDIILGHERRSVAARRLLGWATAMAAYGLLLWYRIGHPDLPKPVTAALVLGLPLGLYALASTMRSLMDTIAPRHVPCLRAHLHFADGAPDRACVLHDGRVGQASLAPTVMAIEKELSIRVTVLRTDAPIEEHRTTSCRC